jgi:23S rRNA (guanosine2251-2'-O)-methyltransferase
MEILKLGKRSNKKVVARDNSHTALRIRVKAWEEDDLFDLLDDIEETPFLLILDGVQDPHNLGACLRSADGAGVHAVIAPKDRAASLTDTVRKISCGGAENVPFIQVTNLSRTLSRLKDRGIWLVGTSDRAEKSVYETNMKGPLGIVMGAEGKGARRLTLEKCDYQVYIPMFGKVECLNVSVATGVCLFEAVRQRLGS